MKKRFLVILLALAATLCLAFALAGCAPTPNGNTGNTTEQSGNSGDSGNTNTPEGGNTGSTTEPETPDTGNTEHVHDWGEWVLTTPATCSTQGEETRTCKSDENHKETRKTQIDPTAHKLKHIEAQAATCVAKGWNDHDECELCGYSENKIESNIDPEAHDWGEWKVTTPATCSAQGEEIRTCKLDENHTESHKTSIDPNAHTYGTDNVCTGCKQPWNFTANLQYELSTDNKSYSVTGIGTATETNIVIPYFYNKLPVTSIGGSAFDYCTSLKSITIPDGVTSIGDRAFYKCASLESVTIPESVITIREGAFDACTNLESVNFGNNSKLESIGNYAFEDCTSLTSITIPDSVTSIGNYAFNKCTNLTGVYITNLKTWCCIEFVIASANPLYYAHNLYLNNKLVTEITADMLQGVTEIDKAFYYYTSLTSIEIPDSVTSIGDRAFEGCTSLESINVGENNTAYSSQDGILYNKDKTEIIRVPQTKTVVSIPDSVMSIGNSAFYQCTSLESVNFGNNSKLETIGNYAFEGCTSLESITIPDGVTSIYFRAFSGCTSLESITIPNSVTSIGDHAFYYCKSLTSITIPDSVTSIGYDAFSGCTKLIQTQDGVQYVDKWVVDCATSVTSVNFRANTKGIADMAFAYCRSLTKITIPDGVTSIGDYAFDGCTNLESINFGNNSKLETIGDYAFRECTKLKSITIPDSVIFIGWSAFYRCTSLESVTFENKTGWKVQSYLGGNWTDVNADDSANNAKLLTDTYCSYYWKREG